MSAEGRPSRRVSAPAAELPLRIGSRYEVVEQLGRGGMAIVYRVRDRSDEHEVALKQLIATASSAEHNLTQLFEREFCTLAQLSHPGVVDVYDFGIDIAGPYYTMELLDGGDLSTRAPLPYRDACQLLMQICSSLSLLHSRRFVHRDITPRNIRCTRLGAAKLIDFGAMVPIGPCLLSVGTPAFVAPEVVHHMRLDARTDLFSLGATLYFALTGRCAYAARSMAELSELWRNEPAPPSRLIEGIPAALDELVLAMLRIDPARRPRSAFEVMQRMAAIAGLDCQESEAISRAYLSTPTLVGRDREQRQFRHALRRAAQAQPDVLLFEAAAGVGRSRLLDECSLEAKVAGALVLRLDGSASHPEPFAGALSLARQLLHADPDAFARDVDAALRERLFQQAASTTPVLIARAQLQADPYSAQAALSAWFRAVSQRRLLLIAVDDSERIDDATLALLVALADAASGCQLLILAALTPLSDEQLPPALSVLRRQGSTLALACLDSEQTEALFTSIFFDAPHVALVSHRIHQLAEGRARDAIALAEHLLNTQRVRYADGNWILPAELGPADLPASAADALRLRIEQLQARARGLVEAQALSLDALWSRARYLALAHALEPALVDAALAELLDAGVLVRHGDTFRLDRIGASAHLVDQLSTADLLAQHRALADLCRAEARPAIFEIHHRLLGNEAERALDTLLPLIASPATPLADASGLPRQIVATILEQACLAAVHYGRTPREINELRRMLIELSPTTDVALFARYAPSWLQQLELDSGLQQYRSLAPALPAPERLQRALQHARARHEALPDAERVYAPTEAISGLSRYVTFAVTIGWRTADTRLLTTLAALLEPFAEAFPLLHSTWQNAVIVCEVMHEARLEQARRRYLASYERLRGVSNRELPYAETILFSFAQAIAAIDVFLGKPSALEWVDIIDRSPLHRVNGLFMRRVLAIYEGDIEAAEQLRRKSEVMSVAAGTRQVFDPPLIVELQAQVLAGDLGGLRHVAERAARIAGSAPGWQALSHAAQGYFQHMRGDLNAARKAFEQALALSQPDLVDPPPMLRAWVIAVAGYIGVLAELGELEAACEFGARAIARCAALQITHGSMHVRALALAEAKLGRHERAARRLDRILAEGAECLPSLLAADLEARALVAIWAGDSAAATHFVQRALQCERPEPTPLQLARRGRLLDEAVRAGVELDLPASGFEAAVLARPQAALAIDAQLATALEGLRAPEQRASRVLSLLCGAAQAASGQLYALRGTTLVRSAALGEPPEAALDEYVQNFWQEQLAASAMTTVFTTVEAKGHKLARAQWVSRSHGVHEVVLLQSLQGDECCGAAAFPRPAAGISSEDFARLVWVLSHRLHELGGLP